MLQLERDVMAKGDKTHCSRILSALHEPQNFYAQTASYFAWVLAVSLPPSLRLSVMESLVFFFRSAFQTTAHKSSKRGPHRVGVSGILPANAVSAPPKWCRWLRRHMIEAFLPSLPPAAHRALKHHLKNLKSCGCSLPPLEHVMQKRPT